MRKILVLTAIAGACIALLFVAHKTIVRENSPVSVKWRFETSYYCSPVVAGDMVYVGYIAPRGSEDNCLYAINKDSGELEWEYCEDDPEFLSSPTVADGVVYTRKLSEDPDDRDYLYAIDAASGTLKWRFELGDASVICTSPTVVEGIVYVKSTDTLLYAVDAQSGGLLWSFETGEFILSSAPAAANGVVCITTESCLYTIDALSGELNWQYMMRCPWDLSPAVVDNAVYMGTIDGRLYSIDIVSGEKRWEYECEMYGEGVVITAPPSVVDGMVFLGVTHLDSDYAYNVHNGVIYAIDADSGELQWRYETGEYLISVTTMVNGVIYVATDVTGKLLYNLHAIDAHTGAPKWKYTMEGFNRINSSVTVVDDIIFFNMTIKSNEGIQDCIYALEINSR